jgi:hypothetical protein
MDHGHDMCDIQSGSGIVSNMLMLYRPQKTVTKSPFKQIVQPAALMNKFNSFSHKLADFEAKPSTWKLMNLVCVAIRFMWFNTELIKTRKPTHDRL